jgi:putative transposase
MPLREAVALTGFKIHEPGYPCFITCTVVDWLPIFTNREHCDIITSSLDYCRQRKGLRIHGYVVMPTHLHAVLSADSDLVSIIRDFKSFTSRELRNLIEKRSEELFSWALRRSAELSRETNEQSFWQDGFHPETIYSREFFEQKMTYLHANPVRKGLVFKPEDWRYSSAAVYAGEVDGPLNIDLLDV